MRGIFSSKNNSTNDLNTQVDNSTDKKPKKKNSLAAIITRNLSSFALNKFGSNNTTPNFSPIYDVRDSAEEYETPITANTSNNPSALPTPLTALSNMTCKYNQIMHPVLLEAVNNDLIDAATAKSVWEEFSKLDISPVELRQALSAYLENNFNKKVTEAQSANLVLLADLNRGR